MVMAETSKQTPYNTQSDSIIIGTVDRRFIFGAYLFPHPDVTGQKTEYKAGYKTGQKDVKSAGDKVDRLKITPDAAADIAIPLKRPELASVWLNYSLPQIQNTTVVPAIFTTQMPPEIGDLTVQERKQLFVRILLPLILAANDKIAAERAVLGELKHQNCVYWQNLSADTSNVALETLRASLDKRIRPIQCHLLWLKQRLNQMGHIRFTKEANALYGQWAWRAEDGVKPLEASNSRAVIRKFDTLQESVHSYMKNLNSHYAYEGTRAILAKRGLKVDGFDLAPYLSNYAETGAEYVEQSATSSAEIISRILTVFA